MPRPAPIFDLITLNGKELKLILKKTTGVTKYKGVTKLPGPSVRYEAHLRGQYLGIFDTEYNAAVQIAVTKNTEQKPPPEVPSTPEAGMYDEEASKLAGEFSPSIEMSHVPLGRPILEASKRREKRKLEIIHKSLLQSWHEAEGTPLEPTVYANKHFRHIP